MDLGISGRVALVTGGNGYIGKAIVQRLRAEGATVISASRSSAEFSVDVTDQDSVDAAIKRIAAEHGQIDIVVMTAGTAAQKLDRAAANDPVQVAAAIDAKALSTVRVANAVLPLMRERGWGRFIAVNGQNTYFTTSVMASLRNAAMAFAAKTLADEYAGTGVTVNVVNPSKVTDTPTTELSAFGPGECTPDDVAVAVAFLASDLASRISGESIATGHKARAVATY